jgi:predicted alpha/beta superfamily hydrolase
MLCLVLGNSSGVGARPSQNGELHLHELKSQIFDNTRTIRVWLPPGYFEDGSRHYPVLYLNDGQSVFSENDLDGDKPHWDAEKTAERLIESGEIEPLILVGVDSAGKHQRPNEYLPFPDAFLEPPVPEPRGGEYPRFLRQEVIPLVQKYYRVKEGDGSAAVGGSSYGALAALYAAANYPKLFGRILLESPSLYVDNARILREIEKLESWRPLVYVGVGTNEEGLSRCEPHRLQGDVNAEAVRDVERLAGILQGKGLGERVRTVVEPCARHREEAWRRRFAGALRFLFDQSKGRSK